ncbi:MAG: NADH-quinone oxidoreductase subunit NuoN [Micavibrio aeruginosavorus]|uniref:NADH-quinone oxidoreductase subunit N n=1 Tax=Micavibrio aeruginosavorus TaxID=349221 RepID=A0A2W5FJD7_9BACT|nr:MAG: NADH-quinone oxidoreductase subunit NuoN [Micavibrio aeruginosavorus]
MTSGLHIVFQSLLPELFLSVSALLLLVFGVFRGNSSTIKVLWLTVAVFVVGGVLIATGSSDQVLLLNDMVIVDRFSYVLKFIIALGLIASLVLSAGSLHDNKLYRFEYSILILLSGIGMMLMVSANNLLSLYVSLELSSLCLYVLAAIKRDDLKSSEAGIKYFVLGALSSGLLLFGSSLIYGYTGSLDFKLIAGTIEQNSVNMAPGVIVGMVFILAGLCFKISAVPFHMWAPDVYQGAPTPVTALFAIVTKIAAMGLLIRLLTGPFAAAMPQWSQIIIFVSLASVLLGSLAGLVQENIKRLLAYSSIGNMGFALIGLLAGTPEGIASVIIYLTLYMIMTAGTFGIVMNMRKNGQAVENISDLAGLSKSSPAMAYSLAALMFSMSGIPPLAGFFSKLFVFQAAVAEGYYVVSVIGVLASVIGAYYYLRIIKVMFFDKSEEKFDANIYASRSAVIFVSVLLTVLFILAPNELLTFSTQAAQSLFE